MITIIAAVAANRAIGFENKLLYWLPNDLEAFQDTHHGSHHHHGTPHIRVAPQGCSAQPPQRGAQSHSHRVRRLRLLYIAPRRLAHCAKDEDIYIIGGASVYEQALPIADRLCLTEIHDTPANADAFFPEYDGWKETAREEHTTDEKHHQAYAFVDYVRE